MKTIEETRRENLRRLIQDHGGVAKLAGKVGMKPPQLSAWVNASLDSATGKPRGMRSESARAMEKVLDLEHAWLDNDHARKPELEAEEKELLDAFGRLNATNRTKVKERADALLDGQGSHQRPKSGGNTATGPIPAKTTGSIKANG